MAGPGLSEEMSSEERSTYEIRRSVSIQDRGKRKGACITCGFYEAEHKKSLIFNDISQ
jgi:hypothetical protein